MSSMVQFADLMLAVRAWTNTENQAGVFTDKDVRRALNQGLQELHEKLVAARGQEHIRKAFPLSVVANQSSYSLPPDFFELISIDIQIGPNQFLSCRPYMEPERNAFRLYPGWSGWYMGLPVYFRIQGSTGYANSGTPAEKTISFIPTSTSTFPVTLNYVYAFPRFDLGGAQDANYIDSINGWTDYAVWYAAAIGRAKMKEDPMFALQERERIGARIQELAGQNASGDAERIRDVESGDLDGLGWWR
jgi:hypothetical protein